MKRRISFIIFLMTICTALLLALQVYWNDEVYKNNDRVFRSDVNDALDKSVNKLMDIRRDELAQAYKKWMADTNLIVISCQYDSIKKTAIFSIQDKYPPKGDKRPPSRITFNEIHQTSDHISSSVKTMIINSFVKNFVFYDLRDAKVYYHTTNLGERLSQAFANDQLDTARLGRLYAQALQKRGIDNPFSFRLTKYNFEKFDSSTSDSFGEEYHTRQFNYGFNTRVLVGASFNSPKLIYLQKMKWVLSTSFFLILITLSCFVYTVKTMLSQKKLMLLKDDFVNNMTHEFKTPVATISVAAEAIENFGIDKASQSTYIGIIRAQVESLSHLIDQTLTNLLHQNARISLRKQELDLKEIVEQVLFQYQPQFLVSNIKVNLDMGEEVFMVMADFIHIRNVIANLIDNAVKYGGEGGEIMMSLVQKNQYVVFEITNGGIEIPAIYLAKVFEPFFRVPTGNEHQVKGYGLGLSYVSDIVKQHHGEINVSSALGLTTFTLKLPLYES